MRKLREFMGIEGDGEHKLKLKHIAINETVPIDIDFNSSPHCYTLQRSEYISIDNQIEDRFYKGIHTLRHSPKPPSQSIAAYMKLQNEIKGEKQNPIRAYLKMIEQMHRED